jgi:hypothetical protein
MELHEPTEQEKQSALDELTQYMNAVQKRRDSIPHDELQSALEAITRALAQHWSTGGGTRLRRFIWSLWNGWHLVNLFDLCAGLDCELGDAVIVIFRAQMVGALSEKHKRRVLTQSGEFDRWQSASAETPDGEDVLYPPLSLGTDELRRLAHSATQYARRMEAESATGISRFIAD